MATTPFRLRRRKSCRGLVEPRLEACVSVDESAVAGLIGGMPIGVGFEHAYDLRELPRN
jgi:hypothetical protein